MRLLPYLCLFLLTCAVPANAQRDTNTLKKLYDRALDFDASKADSLLHIARFIKRESLVLNYKQGAVLSLRLRGIHAELKGQYDSAISYYYRSLSEALKLRHPAYISAAYSDLAIVYSALKQYDKARDMYRTSARFDANHGNLQSAITAYSNMGAIFNNLKMYDSAIYIMKRGLALAATSEDSVDMTSLYNNIGNSYFLKKEYKNAFPYFWYIFDQYCYRKDREGEWTAAINLADIHLETSRADSSRWYLEMADTLSKMHSSLQHRADTYAMWAKYYEKTGQHKLAYQSLQNWYTIDTALVNSERNSIIAELQETFNAQERERQNELLSATVSRQKWVNRVVFTLFISLFVIATLIGYLLYQDRKTNRLLQQQNTLIQEQYERLNQLNTEKNLLISMVSHDLSTPIAGIRMWSQVMQREEDLSDEQRRALGRIQHAAQQGEDLIRNLLDVERGFRIDKLSLEKINLTQTVSKVVQNHVPHAQSKNIQLSVDMDPQPLIILSDYQLVQRVLDNLLSNALKFTPEGKNVWVEIQKYRENICIQIGDEGPGIPEEEQEMLFKPYTRLSARPTAGETSTGLGLSIVKRLVGELNGEISVQSRPGQGSIFSVWLPA